MTLDDESILSAYLDGQLGPEEQQAVESALFADPHLAEELRGLTLLRDLMAGLPREGSPDVTSRVMRRVRRRAPLGRMAGSVAWGSFRAAALVAIAAGVLAVLALPWFVHIGRGPAGGRGLAPVAQHHSRALKARPPVSETLWPPFSSHPAGEGTPQSTGTGERRPSPSGGAGDEPAAPGELVHVREYLDNPQLRRIFLVSDLEDGSAQQQVASVVEQTTRFNFFKITISQGIVIDPRHPDRATVFALVVGPRELESLRERLRTALHDRVEETTVEPTVVTQLADIGDVEACRPSPVADMAIPRDAALAVQYPDAAGGGGEAAEAPAAEHAKEPDRPTLEQERSSPVAEIARASQPRAVPDHGAAVGGEHRPPDGPARARPAEPSYVVLVWVSRPRPG